MRMLAVCLFTLTFATTASAVVNAPVNIVYPLSGGVYKNYFNSSFSLSCAGGPHKVAWYFDSTGGSPIGTATFYDEFSVQFHHKLPSGLHALYVISDCGAEKVGFKIL